MILQTNDWFENKIQQLQLIVDKQEDSKLLFQNDAGEQVEMPAELKKGFVLGIITAIDVMGKFPIKISRG